MTGFAEPFNTVKCLNSSLLTLKTLPKPGDCPSLAHNHRHVGLFRRDWGFLSNYEAAEIFEARLTNPRKTYHQIVSPNRLFDKKCIAQSSSFFEVRYADWSESSG